MFIPVDGERSELARGREGKEPPRPLLDFLLLPRPPSYSTYKLISYSSELYRGLCYSARSRKAVSFTRASLRQHPHASIAHASTTPLQHFAALTMSVTAVPLALMPPTDEDREEEQRIAAKQADPSLASSGKKPSTWAAVTRALFGSLAFLFKRPIRLFRPVKISTWTGIQAIAEEQGRSVTPSFVRGLIRKEGVSGAFPRVTPGFQIMYRPFPDPDLMQSQWRFFPRHVLPPLIVNTAVGLTLFTCYTASQIVLLSCVSPPDLDLPPPRPLSSLGVDRRPNPTSPPFS